MHLLTQVVGGLGGCFQLTVLFGSWTAGLVLKHPPRDTMILLLLGTLLLGITSLMFSLDTFVGVIVCVLMTGLVIGE
jgi:hypothetical protein